MPKADFTYKLCIFGDKGVGKTCLAYRYLTSLFEVNTKTTMGAAVYIKYVKIENKNIVIQIWDFGGEEQFRFLLPAYAFGSFAGIFMYDVTKRSTLEKFNDWLICFNEGLKDDKKEIPIFIVGGKIDLIEQRCVSIKNAKNLTKSKKILEYFECSAKTGENVEKIFEKITRIVMQKSGVI